MFLLYASQKRVEEIEPSFQDWKSRVLTVVRYAQTGRFLRFAVLCKLLYTSHNLINHQLLFHGVYPHSFFYMTPALTIGL